MTDVNPELAQPSALEIAEVRTVMGMAHAQKVGDAERKRLKAQDRLTSADRHMQKASREADEFHDSAVSDVHEQAEKDGLDPVSTLNAVGKVSTLDPVFASRQSERYGDWVDRHDSRVLFLGRVGIGFGNWMHVVGAPETAGTMLAVGEGNFSLGITTDTGAGGVRGSSRVAPKVVVSNFYRMDIFPGSDNADRAFSYIGDLPSAQVNVSMDIDAPIMNDPEEVSQHLADSRGSEPPSIVAYGKEAIKAALKIAYNKSDQWGINDIDLLATALNSSIPIHDIAGGEWQRHNDALALSAREAIVVAVDSYMVDDRDRYGMGQLNMEGVHITRQPVVLEAISSDFHLKNSDALNEDLDTLIQKSIEALARGGRLSHFKYGQLGWRGHIHDKVTSLLGSIGISPEINLDGAEYVAACNDIGIYERGGARISKATLSKLKDTRKQLGKKLGHHEAQKLLRGF